MYVRWKRRVTRKQVIVGHRRKIVDGRPAIYTARDGRRFYETEPVRESQPTGDYALSAQIVESHRVDGKPRQKVIKYLGTINESGIGNIGHRIGFWRSVSASFKALNLPAEQQHAIEQSLHARVSFPTPEETEQYRAEMDALFARWRDIRSA